MNITLPGGETSSVSSAVTQYYSPLPWKYQCVCVCVCVCVCWGKAGVVERWEDGQLIDGMWI